MIPALIPELDVTSIEILKRFYTKVCGFEVEYERPEEKFVMLSLGDAYLMLEEAAGPGRRFCVAELQRPFGRGMNLQIRVSDVGAIANRVASTATETIIPLEERWYRSDDVELGNLQFVIADPDGYLLRFFTDLGSRFWSADCCL